MATGKKCESNTSKEEGEISNTSKEEGEITNTSKEERAISRKRESSNSEDEKIFSGNRESNNSKDEKTVGRKPREALKRKRKRKWTSVRRKIKKDLTKSEDPQRCPPLGPGGVAWMAGDPQKSPPLGPGGVAWVYPGTKTAVKPGDKAHFKIEDTAEGDQLRVGEIVFPVIINNTPQLKVCWFYSPEQTPEGRQKHHSVAELMASFHHTFVNLDSIVEKVNVYDSVDEYDSVGSRGAHDYFYRFFYNHDTRKILAMDNPELYCVCQSIYNPDLLMVQCNACQRWYHTSCVSIPQSKARSSQPYYCPSCTSSGASS